MEGQETSRSMPRLWDAKPGEQAFGLRDWTPAYPELLFGWSKPSWNSALRQGAVAPTTAGVGKVTRVSKSVIHSKSSSRRLDSKG